MTKKFCDICGKPATDRNPSAGITKPHGDPWVDMNGEKRQPVITVRVRFGFECHRQGYGGPPDLCEECVLRLLEDVLKDAGALKS